jgi:hypothetical protein
MCYCMQGKIIILGILFLCFSEATGISSYSYVEDNFEINHVSNYVDENGIMHVFGEVKNLGNRSMTNVTVSADFFDPDGKTINEFRRSTELRTINSGFVSPFEILFLDQENVDRVKNFKLYANGTETRTQPISLQTKIESSRLDLLGFYYINGVISNSGPLTAHNSIAIATLYDLDGRVIAIGRGLAEPAYIDSNSGASFGLAIVDKLQTHKAKSYSVVADSDEYVSKPTMANVK